ncbi:MAG: hypothetical protein FOGNACKC_02199 [Anaerolineae bacterium]|nr:hypothetical protein [Anaerolineae bacterium]
MAYVTAVVARAGAVMYKPDSDYGVDYMVSEVVNTENGNYVATSATFACQLKATITSQLEDGYVVYDMKVEAYNKLANYNTRAGLVVNYLVLMHMPRESQQWLCLTEEQLLLKNCCYWCKITELSNNRERQRIRIPRTQVFNPEAVVALLERARQNYR